MMFYSALRGGTGLGLLLLPLVPLPTLIASLGWGLSAGVAAMLAGCAVIAGIAAPLVACGYALLLGLPAILVTHVLMLARYDAAGALTHWYPAGRVVWTLALYGAALPVLLVALDGGSFDAVTPELMRAFKLFAVGAPAGSEWHTMSDQRLAELVAIGVQLMPAAISGYWTLLFAINVYLAGRIVRLSGLIERPWPDLHWLTLPALAALVLVAGIVGIWIGGALNVIGTSAFGALLIAFLLQGLAVIHAMAHARAATWAISATYTALILVNGVAMTLIALLGVAETIFHLRRRIVPPPIALPPGSL